MKKGLTTALFILLTSSLFPGSNTSATYAYLSEIFGIDDNAGLNSFLTLTIPAGGKYEGMGTAFTAMSSDSSFLDSNPAGSSFVKNSELTFYHNNWIEETNIESVTYTARWDSLGVGIGGKFLYLPFTGIDEWGDRAKNDNGSYATGYYTETIATANAAYTFLNDYYYHGFSVGTNFKLGYRGIPNSIAPNQSALAVMIDVGLQTRLNVLKYFSSRDKNFSFGLAVKNIGSELIDNPDPLPTTFSTGIAYSPIKPLTWAFDINYPFNLDGTPSEAISYSTGFDINLASFLSVQSGFLLKQGLPRFSVGTSFDAEKFSITANYTLDLTTQFTKLDRFSLSLRLNLGDLGRMSRNEKAQILYLEGLEVYANGNISGAIDLWEECLSIREDFTPAKEMIQTARKTLELDNMLQQNQTIEDE